MKKFSEEFFDKLGHYVYRLIDPRDNKTFYVGEGCRNRVFDHINDELKFAKSTNDYEVVENEVSSKMQTIRDIRKAGLEVKHVIHRYGMDQETAFEVEAALIDAYTELDESAMTNVVSGHNADRGLIDTEELIKALSATEYDDNDIGFDYIIVKIIESNIKCNNDDVYETARKAWTLNLETIHKRNIKYVLATVNGIVKEVYEIEEWKQSSESDSKVEFKGHVAPDNIRNIVINQRIPAYYRKRGMAASALYKKIITQVDKQIISAADRNMEADTADTLISESMCNSTQQNNHNKTGVTMSDLTKIEYNDADINFDYIIVKTKESTIENNGGDVYEAARKAWTLSLDKIKKRNINYVLVTVSGVVREVYEIEEWKQSSESDSKVEFKGHVAPDAIRNKVIDKLIPSVYRQQGMAASSLYKTQNS